MGYIGHVTHYSHKNICRGITEWKGEVNDTRDFRDLEHMNRTIVDNINNVVKQEDVLIHLGDFSFGGIENIKKFRSRIICENIYLTFGNHDHHIKNDREGVKSLFKGTYIENTLEVDGVTFFLKHYPMASWEDMKKGVVMLYGHLHSSNQNKFPGIGKIMDVGIDGHPEFRPYNIRREIIPVMNKRPIMSLLDTDRHGKIKTT